MSVLNRSAYLGENKGGPRPVWRDEADDAKSWPIGAVFKIQFTPENSPGFSVTQCAIPRTEFFGADGWPLELPEDRKKELTNVIKLEFQISPCNWQAWNQFDWERVVRFPEHFVETRALAGALRPLVQMTSALS
jgi:hypothetical protein